MGERATPATTLHRTRQQDWSHLGTASLGLHPSRWQVDLGGGTGSNVEMMEKHISLDRFEAIYVVDLCHSLCEEAKLRVKDKGQCSVLVDLKLIRMDECACRGGRCLYVCAA